jgi:multiple sugar transport system ATP-binding protein
MVFQSYALYPNMTVADNIAFAMKLRKTDKAEMAAKVAEVAELLELTAVLDRKPGQLSGGQRQRVAMGRAIVRNPKLFLMDEPLSNLDAKLRVQTRAEISKLQRRLGVTTMYVTHDQIEAMTMGDRVAVLSRGRLQQVDSPQNLYDHPDNIFVATFIGSPQMNMLRGHYDAGAATLTVGSNTLSVPESVRAARPSLANYDGKALAVGIRPEHIADAALGGVEGRSTMKGDVEVREGLGSEVLLHIAVDAGKVTAEDIESETPGDEHSSVIVARVAPTSKLTPGDTAELAVDTSHLQLFDLDSGLAIR